MREWKNFPVGEERKSFGNLGVMRYDPWIERKICIYGKLWETDRSACARSGNLIKRNLLN